MQDRLETTEPAFVDRDDRVPASAAKQTWRKPEITTFVPASEARGIGNLAADVGVNNLC